MFDAGIPRKKNPEIAEVFARLPNKDRMPTEQKPNRGN
jgi:hypothetical protein